MATYSDFQQRQLDIKSGEELDRRNQAATPAHELRRKPILCLDFDGVLHSYTSGWKGADVIPDDPVPGAFEFLFEAVKHFDVQVYSSRSGQAGGINAMQAWMIERLGLHTGFVLDEIGWPDEKPAAMVTIDDRALTFDGTWPAMEVLKAFKPWNKR